MARTLKSQGLDAKRTALILPRSKYKSELNKLITEGESILGKNISNSSDLSNLESPYYDWFSFSLEFLKTSFNKPYNEYRDRFERAAEMLGVFDAIQRNPAIHTFPYEKQQFIDKVTSKVGVLKQLLSQADIVTSEIEDNNTPLVEEKDYMTVLSLILTQFHTVAQTLKIRRKNRVPLTINDEYDVQYLLLSLLSIHFDDIRPEDFSPSYAGGNSRIDFVLKNEKTVVETKMTNENLREKEIGEELLIDIGRYRLHPDCHTLIVFVYDKEGFIRNKAGLIKDLEQMSSSNLKVKIFIQPK